MEARRCYRCTRFGSPFAFRRARASFYDAGLVRELIRVGKYGGYPGVLTALMRYVILDWPVDVDGVIPIPSSPAHRRERGYVPTYTMARAVARTLEIPLWDVLEIRGGRPQAGVASYEARVRNARGRLRLRRRPPSGVLRVLLVDDVITTGATLHEAARRIRDSGVHEVVAWCLATEVPRAFLPPGNPGEEAAAV